MTVRLKLALTVFATGLITALLVVATVVYSFQRFENETAYRRGMAFLTRVVMTYDSIVEMQDRQPGEFQTWLRNLVLFEPDTELYLLDLQGTVRASSGKANLPHGFKVALQPVLDSIDKKDASFVMGDDPERMDANAVVVAKPVRRGTMRAVDPVAGYLYLVLHTQQLPEKRWDVVRSSLARPLFGLIAAVVLFTTLLSLVIISQVTQPLFRLTRAVAGLSQRGLDEGLAASPQSPLPKRTNDEFGQLTVAFEMLLDVCRRQWNALRRVDHYRREGVSNLSHDLRSPLTATVACLETLEGRWADAPARADDRRLVEMALRNTRNAARLVRSLGDLAKLDEPEFTLRRERVDVGELLDDIVMRFAERASQLGVVLRHARGTDEQGTDERGTDAQVDIELFERAIANLVDNALKFGARVVNPLSDVSDVSDVNEVNEVNDVRASTVTLAAMKRDGRIEISVTDTGPGIAAAELPHLFDRFYQSRASVAPSTGDGGKGLGLAIVKRIAELHGGTAVVSSTVGAGTRVVLSVPIEAATSQVTPSR